MGWRRRAARLALLVLAIVCVLAWVNREALLRRAGMFLLEGDVAAKADVAVVVRGDEIRFDRALKAAGLFHDGFIDRIYVSSALDDLAARALADKAVRVASGQDNIVSVLVQQGVPCERIMVDGSMPGGGTDGEMRRLRAFMKSSGLTSALLVTSWFHAHRLKRTAAAVLPEFRIAVIAADPPAAQDWWRRRYVAQTVFEEYVKLALSTMAITPGFSDDPPSGERMGPVRQPPQCAVAAPSAPPAGAKP
jgi:uncharacterized SAM-binding protein YcdF (DUF218 family)